MTEFAWSSGAAYGPCSVRIVQSAGYSKDKWPSGKVKVLSVGAWTGGVTGAVVATAGAVGVADWVGTAVGVAEGVAVALGDGVAEVLGVGAAASDDIAGAGAGLTVPKFDATRTPAVTAAAPKSRPPAIRAFRRRLSSSEETFRSGLVSL